jgi:hypothetical protein
VSDRAWRKPSTERDLHPTLHQKVEGSSTATTYNYTRDRNRIEKRLEKI